MNYKKLGLKIGIEIHQRLDTKHKLFCSCPTKLSENEIREVKRRQRPIAGELGDVDPATLYEYYKNRKFYYKCFDTNCLIELDSDFPKPLNPEALQIALQLAKLLKLEIPDQLHIMRKIVTDGSNTAGYQRTVLIGQGTKQSIIMTKSGKVRIKDLELEEESAGIEGEDKGKITYRLDRLGIPLVEIGTESDITTPEQALEIAEHIGLLLRSLKVKRGIGTIRQDVNVSVKGGARVEIKGFQDLKNIPLLITNEIQRQLTLLEIKNKIKTLKIEQKKVTELFRNSKCRFLKQIVISKGEIIALNIKNFAGLMKTPCGGKTFGKELAYYVMPFGPQGFVDSDEDLDSYQLKQEFEELKKLFSATDNDLILVMGYRFKEDLEKATNALIERLKFCKKGVPEETRVALPDATTKYTRPLPGSGRLYPETDLPPIDISDLVKKIKPPKTLFEKKKQLEKEIGKEMAKQLLTNPKLELYEKLKKFGPVLVADLLLSQKGKVDEKKLVYILTLVRQGQVSKDIVKDALQTPKSKILKKYQLLTKTELQKIVRQSAKKGLNQKAVMGLVMAKVKGRADGKLVAELVKKMVK
jgi:glutamyl-tRNA(Gln) amidotransferase subunit E